MTRPTKTAAAGIVVLLLSPLSVRPTLQEPPPDDSGVVMALLRRAKFDEARDAALRLRERLPASADVRALSGDALWGAGLFDEAEDEFDAALAIDPDHPRARDGRARALAARGQLQHALDEAIAATRLSPSTPDFHHTLAAVYERLNRYDEAAAALETYANLLPPAEKSAWAMARVKFLRSFERQTPLDFGDRTGPFTVPVRIVGNKVLVRGRVNGGTPVDFVLDTGSEQVVLSGRVAARAGVRPVTYVQSAGVGQAGMRPLQAARVNSLQVGSMHVRNVPVLIKSPGLPDVPGQEADTFSPLALGLSMVLDYERRELTLAPMLPEEPFDITLPLRMHRLAMVRGTAGGRAASFVVDTGGEAISLSTRTAEAIERVPGVRHVPLRVWGSSGWDPTAFLLPYVDLAFADIGQPNTSVIVLDLDAPSALLGFKIGGIIGHRFLRDYRVTIDLPRARVGLVARR